jgi:hydroxyacylglutathione hydrolase
MKIFRYTTGPIMVNTYLVFDETKKGFIVDPGGYSRQLVDKIKAEDIEVEYIILTHGHGDHIGGIEELRKEFPEIRVVAYCDEADFLQNADLNNSVELFGHPITVAVDKYVKDRETLKVGNMEMTFAFTPGHTPGGMCIIMDGYVFSGDTLFRASIGRTDFYGGDFAAIIRSIKERLFVLPDTTVVLPGHMEDTTIGYEKENNPFVR